MKNYKGIWLPDSEEHLQEWHAKVIARQDAERFTPMRDGRMTYQYHKYEAALRYCKDFKVALDIGAHVGLWSRVMALDFKSISAFEPVEEHRKCWVLNMQSSPNAVLHPVALGEVYDTVAMFTRTENSSGDTAVKRFNDSMGIEHSVVSMFPLDHFNFESVDFIKIDNEGYEYFVLKGAEQTLRRCHPCVIIEQKPGMAQRFGLREQEGVYFLQSLGAKLRVGIQGDYVLSWD